MRNRIDKIFLSVWGYLCLCMLWEMTMELFMKSL